MHTSRIEYIQNSLGFLHTSSFGKYLGCQVYDGSLKTADFNYILVKIQRKLSAWLANLSLDGRKAVI